MARSSFTPPDRKNKLGPTTWRAVHFHHKRHDNKCAQMFHTLYGHRCLHTYVDPGFRDPSHVRFTKRYKTSAVNHRFCLHKTCSHTQNMHKYIISYKGARFKCVYICMSGDRACTNTRLYNLKHCAPPGVQRLRPCRVLADGVHV